MMPYHHPIPESKQSAEKDGSGTSQANRASGGVGGLVAAWVQAEKMIQIALVLPCAGFIGWLIGAGFDKWLHKTWIGMLGVGFGIVAGLVGVIQMAFAFSANPKSGGNIGNGPENGSPGDPS